MLFFIIVNISTIFRIFLLQMSVAFEDQRCFRILYKKNPKRLNNVSLIHMLYLKAVHFCLQVLVEHAGRWKTDEDPLPLLEVYTVAILSFSKAASCLASECDNAPLLLEKLAL